MQRANESLLVALDCSRCRTTHDADRLQRYCSCGGPLMARYDIGPRVPDWSGLALATRPPGIWKYHELLPVRDERFRHTLGEGATPMLGAPRLGDRIGLRRLFLKDEGLCPTGSFKARGLCVAVSRAAELGAATLCIPTAGNAGSALAAYCARGGLRAVIYVPVETPCEFLAEYAAFGAEVVQVEGTIADAGARMAAEAEPDWFPVSTLQEPYRLEGKKTMGFELAEQLGWRLPDVIVYPTGGGTGLIGMWKAFEELETMGLIGASRPRMVAVQASGCAPIVRAFEAGAQSAAPWEEARTMASGLRVPKAFADREILSVLRSSEGTALTVDDDDMIAMVGRLAAEEGVYAAPEAAATIVGAAQARQAGVVSSEDIVLCFLTGNAYKYQSSLFA